MNYFTEQDDFTSIIKDELPHLEIKKLKRIQTGWTNVVIDVETDRDAYIFRFPRNRFFSKMIKKDHAFCEFIKDKTSFQVPEMFLRYHEGRPFSMHKKIKGISLSEKFPSLSPSSMTALAGDISKFICELNQIPVADLPESCRMSLSDFLDELSGVDEDFYDFAKHDSLRDFEKDSFISHGDLNPGNILLDENDRMVAVLDFAFAGYSSSYADISRIIGRSPSSFGPIMMQSYEKVSGYKIDSSKITALLSTWQYVEQEYVSYMKKNHPEIVLPEGN